MVESTATTSAAYYDYPVNEPSVDENTPYARALYDFQGEYDNELTFSVGDIIYLTRKVDDEWLEGKAQKSGNSGIFPTSFVEVVVDFDGEKSATSCANRDQSVTPTVTSGVASVLHDFAARYEDELAVNAGDSVKVVEIIDDNWARCQNLSNGKCGIVPQSFLQIFLDNEQVATAPNYPPIDLAESNGTGEIPWDNEALKWQNESAAHKTAPLPAPVQTFDAHDFDIFETSKSHKKEQPPRPPPPKQGVVAEIPKRSNTALLPQVQNCVSKSSYISDENKRVLTNGIPILKSLSQKLIENLNIEKAKPANLQCYGQMFMHMKEQFFQTFSYHCRSVEQISQIVENNENRALQDALNKCIAEMRKMGSNIFDVPTAISRPIQRCLKYPLYIGELLKNTPINHIDHPKLLESLKQLGNLASKMNESKRRKELIKKYREDQQLSLVERLSRINMHSLAKKSNRLKYRISSSIGLTTIKDTEFEYLISLLDSAERRLCKFLYCAQLYKKNVELAFKKHEESYKGVCPTQDEEAVKSFASMYRTLDRISKEGLQHLENNIINEGKQLVRCEYTKLIHKRCDKLADYETAMATNKNAEEIEMRKNEYEALNNQVKASLPKLITTLNKKVTNLVHKLHEFDSNLLKRMEKWFKEERSQKIRSLTPNAFPFHHFLSMVQRNRFHEIDKLLRTKTTDQKSNAETVRTRSSFKIPRKMTSVLTSLRSQTPKERDALVKIMRAEGKLGELRRVKVDFVSAKIKLTVNDVVIVKGHKFGSCLCDNCVAMDYVPLEYLAPYDDSFSPSYRPASLPAMTRNEMEKFKSANILPSNKIPKRQSVFEGLPESPLPKSNSLSQMGSKDLIDLEENLIDLSPTVSAPKANLPSTAKPSDNLMNVFSLIDYEREPRSARTSSLSFATDTYEIPPQKEQNTPFPVVFSQSIDSFAPQATTNYEKGISLSASKHDPFADLFRSAINTPLSKVKKQSESPAPEIPERPEAKSDLPKAILNEPKPAQDETSNETYANLPSIPIRAAPLPPLPLPVKMEESNNMVRCNYDFSPEPGDNNQIVVAEGEMVVIQQKHDDAGNDEWWLVKKQNSETGYVPAAYLIS
ncbi:SH3 domain-containing protein [Ditylenchus destructor]|uniref:SH3 domain-containing protein n=1 Tax=Ditylenchus destructor TaxID=166010 RepID=A0AAD4RCH7_9BILA|nr:SH3 domain-containing protein [Ditylenchus destructor]